MIDRILVYGGGLYGAHLTSGLRADGYYVELHEIANHLFAGASGNIPARCHQGQHYPRSKLTRQACQEHHAEFMARYGEFTSGIPVNVYAIAEHDSLLDFGTYTQVLRDEIEFVTVARPAELGLQNVEGAILTGERHILVDRLRDHFAKTLDGHIRFGVPAGQSDGAGFDAVVDCTFCANDSIGIDRFEACLTVLLEGPTDRCITIMDAPLPSLYVWDESRKLCSLTSAKWTPLATCPTWHEARKFLNTCPTELVEHHANQMFEQMATYYPRIRDEYRIVDYRTAIRALPRSAADARLCEVIRVGERGIRIRAGKLDAIFHAEREVKRLLAEMAGERKAA
jgi:hypothetical protein